MWALLPQSLGGILQCWQLLGTALPGWAGESLILCEPWWLSWDLVSKLKLSVRELTADEELPSAVGALSRDATDQPKTLHWPLKPGTQTHRPPSGLEATCFNERCP